MNSGCRFGSPNNRSASALSQSGKPQVSASTPFSTSLTQSPARQPLASHEGVQKCLRPQGKQYALRHPEHHPNDSPSGVLQSIHSVAPGALSRFKSKFREVTLSPDTSRFPLLARVTLLDFSLEFVVCRPRGSCRGADSIRHHPVDARAFPEPVWPRWRRLPIR